MNLFSFWLYAASQLVCVERCSQPVRRLGTAHATSQLACVERCSQPVRHLGTAHATSQLACVERCSQPVRRLGTAHAASHRPTRKSRAVHVVRTTGFLTLPSLSGRVKVDFSTGSEAVVQHLAIQIAIYINRPRAEW